MFEPTYRITSHLMKLLEVIAAAMAEIRDDIGIDLCASLGRLNEESLSILKRSGLSRYHHNI